MSNQQKPECEPTSETQLAEAQLEETRGGARALPTLTANLKAIRSGILGAYQGCDTAANLGNVRILVSDRLKPVRGGLLGAYQGCDVSGLPVSTIR